MTTEPIADHTEKAGMSWADATEEAATLEEAKKPKAPERVVLIAGEPHVLRKDECTGSRRTYVKLSDDELRAKGKELARLGIDVDSKEESLKAYSKYEKGRIEELVSTKRSVAQVVSSGFEERHVDVVTIRDDETGEMVTLDVATGNVVDRRRMSASEKQLPLPDPEPDEETITVVDSDGVEQEVPKARGKRSKKAANGVGPEL